MLYHGWNDPAISALNTVNYYDSVVAKMGRGATNTFVRLYMIPGMQHCGGGPGADEHRAVRCVAGQETRSTMCGWRWRTGWRREPRRTAMTATKNAGDNPQGAVTMTRLLCPYPQSAKYKGSGDPNRAESFVCVDGGSVNREPCTVVGGP